MQQVVLCMCVCVCGWVYKMRMSGEKWIDVIQQGVCECVCVYKVRIPEEKWVGVMQQVIHKNTNTLTHSLTHTHT